MKTIETNGMELTIEEIGMAAGGGIGLAEGVTKEDQIAMVRRHFRQRKALHYIKPADSLQEEIDLNNQIMNSFLTTEDIVRIFEEIYGTAAL